MSVYTSIDHSTNPPTVEVPRDYNAATDFIDRHLEQGRADKVAILDETGSHTYGALADRVNRSGNALLAMGAVMEQRIMMCVLDTIDFPAVFFGGMKAGLVPVATNTLLTTKDYDYMLSDSRARILVVSDLLYEKFEPLLADAKFLDKIVIAGQGASEIAKRDGHLVLDDLIAAASNKLDTAPTVADDAGFWLYSSGSTGAPKGAVHLQSDLVNSAVLYGEGVLGIREDDIVFSAAKLFFAYGLGNGMSFPLHVGATAVLMSGRPTPETVMAQLKQHNPTIYYGVPTLYGAMLADDNCKPENGSNAMRACVSAGEALPEDIARRWKERFEVDILDGLGSTEMLHIFLSNAPDDLRYGTSGKAVPGYDLKLVGEDDLPVAQGEIGELIVRGPTTATVYFNNRAKSTATFQGAWTRTGDKYTQDEDGYFVYSGRSDDMLKVGGIWVSPFEVESALLAHEAVLEVAVVGKADGKDLIKPQAHIVLKEGKGSDELAEELKAFVKDRLALYKYPRWIEFVEDLPKTATGKIQRYKLRA
ncbi:MAG: benzoate-CoA ligase family protein [Alphaproteobacteria bacterium]|jgi:4-hydroxybenzoate-CoA ligase|nr:benzoate-CoA ligase family protein [Alphaproteobacteria bacterium]MBT4082447.1 benzoate-CoA ligase family protein [Alphaproteobacteria bacterium]MBT4545989.1 benzoate-CoA ligase family protein [Alphaproteobacteria bacterium]MBT7743889.1 benzoate-CoA ligase family protein [Alphaproteobacteria bacterium]